MENRISWITHQGTKILMNDYKGLREPDFTKAIQESERQCLNSGLKTIHAINDITDSVMGNESTEAAKHWETACKEKGVELKLALVGISGIKKILASLIKRNAYFANNIDDAKEWLLK
ncbi:MAG: hypothetical protein A2293_02620 [Elusimicrobia bacterium RIFOXYB2_FULL_49_7]|nr:MAG: hypothetical protein A2293_02620 [Elusimicrobia bacterium RIFOXYB2_FULL_49_7]